jgi:phytoene dehydrogenase-like protein
VLKTDNDHYDAVIIGAGIGGLVCGCYLAKAGMKVLIAEQHFKAGGYCTSFKRKDFIFDAAAHSFGSYREDGNMHQIVKELEVDKIIKIKKCDPTDIIIAPDCKISFWADRNKTIQDFQHSFPGESQNINTFIHYLTDLRPVDFAAFRKITFKNLLDKYFTDEKLKAIIALPVLGNGALPPSKISAFTGSKIFTEFLLDGGYYPEGGMQALSDAFVQRFKELGGVLELSQPVKKISVEDNKVSGIILEKGGFVSAKYIISNCDARQTFFKLLGKKVIKETVLKKISDMLPSLSTFILYLGIDEPFESLPNPGTNLWYLPDYDLDKAYLFAKKGDINNVKGFMVRYSPDKKTILSFVITAFKNKRHWDNNKKILLESFIKRIEDYAIPDLSKHIIYKEAATPYTLYRYTKNYKGAAYGWASLPSQLFTPEFRQTASLNGLYLAGHWTTQTQGIPGAAYIGSDTAKLILRKESRSPLTK